MIATEKREIQEIKARKKGSLHKEAETKQVTFAPCYDLINDTCMIFDQLWNLP